MLSNVACIECSTKNASIPSLPTTHSLSQLLCLSAVWLTLNRSQPLVKQLVNLLNIELISLVAFNFSFSVKVDIAVHVTGMYTDCGDEAGDEYGDWCSEMAGFLDGTGQVIKWLPYQPEKWAILLDHNRQEM